MLKIMNNAKRKSNRRRRPKKSEKEVERISFSSRIILSQENEILIQQKWVSLFFIWATILNRIKWNSNPPITRHMGWNLPKVKTRYFHLDLGGGSGSKFFRIFSLRSPQSCNWRTVTQRQPRPFLRNQGRRSLISLRGLLSFLAWRR